MFFAAVKKLIIKGDLKVNKKPSVYIACGGSGGHFFPGLAIGNRLYEAGCDITYIVTEKEIDKETSKNISNAKIERLPAIAMGKGNPVNFFLKLFRSFRIAQKLYRQNPPSAVLGMGGFSSAAPVLAAIRKGCKTFIHEANSIPGRANRLVAPFVHTCFVHFPKSVSLLKSRRIEVVGMPVRDVFKPVDEVAQQGYRLALGLDANIPTLLVMGGSQGATPINELTIRNLKKIQRGIQHFQVIHLTGVNNDECVRKAYSKLHVRALVYPYFSEMEMVMGAATAVISRAGASSMAEIAAMKIPSILIPLPHAADNHQFYNAQAFEEIHAAILLDQKQVQSNGDIFADAVVDLLKDATKRSDIISALSQWRECDASTIIAKKVIDIAMPDFNLKANWNSDPIL